MKKLIMRGIIMKPLKRTAASGRAKRRFMEKLPATTPLEEKKTSAAPSVGRPV